MEHRREDEKLQGKAILNSNRTGEFSQNNFECMYQMNKTGHDWIEIKRNEMQALLECSRWLLGCCFASEGVFWMVARELVCG